MRYLWSRLIVIFLVIECLGFIVYYNFGPRGIRALRVMKHTKTTAELDIEKIKQENDALRDEIEAWKSGLFLQEKFAREKLALQKENETIYFR